MQTTDRKDGIPEGSKVGETDGLFDGQDFGIGVGICVGNAVGSCNGIYLGSALGIFDGRRSERIDGIPEGCDVDLDVGGDTGLDDLGLDDSWGMPLLEKTSVSLWVRSLA